MSQYLVTTPLNSDYNGKTFGVRFDRGRAVVNEFSIDKALGLTVDEIADRMEKEFNYKVEKIEDGSQAWKSPESVEPVEQAGDWVQELEVAVQNKKKRRKAGADEAPEDSDSEA